MEALGGLTLDLHSSRAGAIVVDRAGVVVLANEAGRGWLGPDGASPFPEVDLEALHATGAPDTRWIERHTTDGTRERALVAAYPRGGGGALLLLTEPPREAASELLRAVLDSVPAMIGYWDRNLRNRFANSVYLDWFGLPAERILGCHIRELLGEEVFAKNLPFMEGALRGEPQRFERDLTTPSGAVRHSHAEYIPDVRGSEVVGFFVLVTDVTPLRAAEAALRVAHDELEVRVAARTSELERANAELAKSNAELEQFAYVASHDLQEPLRMVASYTELLGERYRGRLDERADKYIGYAVEGARRMQELVRALLSISRVGSALQHRVALDPAALARAALGALHARVLETGAEITVEPMPRVLGDATYLVQVFQNLLGNALKFHGEAPPRITVSARAAGAQVEIAVADNGIGLDMAFADRIFQMFKRLHERHVYEGSGIGLSVARKIVELHGGAIGVRSAPGQGATFWFTLPSAPEGEP